MLEILLYLSSGIKRSLGETSQRFNISERTVLRYIRTFRDVGFIIPRPVDGLYSIDKNSPYFREIDQLLHFSREEAHILQKAIHSINDENLLKQNLIRKLYSLYDFDRVAHTIVKKEHSENIRHLINAIKGKYKVILRGYFSANSNEIKDRLVEPFGFTTNYVATWAFDTEDHTCKTFRNTRISSVLVLNERWESEALHKMLPVDIFRITGNKQTHVTIKMTIRASELLKEEYPLSEQFITKTGESEFLLEAPVNSFDGVGRFVMGLCDETEVIKPEALKKYIQKKATRILNDIS